MWIEQDDGWDGVYYECSVCKEDNITKSASKEHYIYKYNNNTQLITIANIYVKILSELIRIIVLYKDDLQNVVFILDIIKSILHREEFNLTLLNEIQAHSQNQKYDFSFISTLFNQCITLPMSRMMA